MKYLNPILVIVFAIFTLGIYALVWLLLTKDQMKAEGATIPTAWLVIIPLVSLYWLWKFCEGIELVTNKGMPAVGAFLLVFLFGSIGMAIIQYELNKVAVK